MAKRAFRPVPSYLTAEEVPNAAQAARRNLAVKIQRIVLEEQGLPAENHDGTPAAYSWELDSLPVEALSALVRERVESYITKPELVEAIKEREERDRAALRKAADAIARGDFTADDEDAEA